MYKQAGNSIVVDVMLAVVREIFKTGVFDFALNNINISEQINLVDKVENINLLSVEDYV